MPEKKVLSNHIANFRKKKFGNYPLSLGELKACLQKFSDEMDTVNVPHHEIAFEDYFLFLQTNFFGVQILNFGMKKYP